MDLYQQRKSVMRWIVICLGLILVSRLFYIQVVDAKYKQLANQNVLRRITIFPPRGLIYDRHGKLIIDNQPEYDLLVIPGQTKKIDTIALCNLLGIDLSFYKTAMNRARDYSRYKPSVFLHGISPAVFANFQENLYRFPGFFYQVRTVRTYPDSAAAHMLGYISEVNPDQIKSSGGYYNSGDYIGTTGLEQSYEKYLRGEKGVRFVLVYVNNQEKGSYDNGSTDTVAIPGHNLHLSLDIELQKLGELLMQNKIGSIVAIDPSTGEILCMVSKPGFNPQLLTGSTRSKQIAALNLDPRKPLFNRATMAPYPPGSTFKPLMALIGLNEGTLQVEGAYPCHGGYVMGPLHVGCHNHGQLGNIMQAISHSCNGYFCWAFRKTIDQKKYGGVRNGLQMWVDYLHAFGLGRKIGIDIPSEGSGIVPGPKYYGKVYGEHGWNSLTIVSDGIGQGELGVTPLQMANMMACFANRGFWYAPHFVHAIEGVDSAMKKYFVKNIVNVTKENFEIVIEGMADVVEEGTGTIAKIPGITICGKTGTAQNPHGKDHSLFAAFAPRDSAKIAIAVVVENGTWGATYGAPIASLMIEQYLTGKIAENRKALLEQMENAVVLP